MFGYGLYDSLNAIVIDWLGGTRASLVVTFVIRLVVGIGWYRMFERTGRTGWKAFVPVLGAYHAFRIAWDDFSFAAIFAGTTFVSWVNVIVPESGNLIITIFSILNVILWWIMAFLTAVSFQTTMFFGLIYAMLPWLGALVFGWSAFPDYQGPWSSDPAVDRKKRKKQRKKALKQAKAKAKRS